MVTLTSFNAVRSVESSSLPQALKQNTAVAQAAVNMAPNVLNFFHFSFRILLYKLKINMNYYIITFATAQSVFKQNIFRAL